MAEDLINWPRVPARKEFEAMSDQIAAAGYTSTAERAQPSKISADGRVGPARAYRAMLGARAPPVGAGVGKSAPF